MLAKMFLDEWKGINLIIVVAAHIGGHQCLPFSGKYCSVGWLSGAAASPAPLFGFFFFNISKEV